MKFFFSFLLGLVLSSCTNVSKKNKSNLPFLPNEASIILKINDFEEAHSLLQNNSLLQQNTKNNLYTFFSNLIPFKTLKFGDSECYLAFSPLGKNDLGTSLIIDAKIAQLMNFESYYLTDHTYNNFLYKEYKFDNQSLYGAQLNNSWVLSDNYLLIENHIKQFENSILYKHPKAFGSLTNESVSLVIINSEINDIVNRLIPNYSKTIIGVDNGWTAGDFNIGKNTLSYNAIYKAEGSKNIDGIFKDLVPQNNRIAEIVPFNADYFTSLTYDDSKTLLKNLATVNSKNYNQKSTKLDDFISEFVEVGAIQHSKSQFIAFRMKNESIDIDNYLEYNDASKDYRGIAIYQLDAPVNFSAILQPVITTKPVHFFIQFGEYYLFSETVEGMKKIIPFIKNKTTLTYKTWYQKFSESLTEESSMLSVINTSYLNKEIKNSQSKAKQKNWIDISFKDYKVAALQMVKEENFSHLNISTLKNTENKKDFIVNETDNLILNSNLLSTPQFVINYINKTKDIVVQDENYKLHVFTNKGILKWSKEIDEPILGEIKQLDMYRNGRLQYLFNTPTKLYILDRNGKKVAPFPLEFDKPITQAVSLFDYDNNRKYRIVVTQDTKLTMFDNKGKKVSGFKFKNPSNGTVTHPPKHIRVGKKDYIIVNENSTGVHILNRTGKTRIKPKTLPSKTYQEWFWYKNAFSSFNTKNTITKIKLDGGVNYSPSNLKNASTAATTKTWASLSENKLLIKEKLIELEFGRYTAPKIFYINNKIYVTTTNLDTKKVYLYDSNATSIKGFPVFGSGIATIDNADKDANLELIVKGDKNSILFYEFR